jgi:PAS domain S-box-containing protein
MWHFDYESESFWLTDYGREMFGFAPGEAITRYAVISRVHPDDRQAAIESMQAATAAGKLAIYEFRIVRPDGEIRWIRCRAGAHGDYHGAPAQISGTFSDLTERRAAEAEVAQQRHELAHLMRVSMLGELSGGIAHELTQPLSAILSNAEAARILLTRKNPNIAEVVEVLDDIIGEDNRAGEVIRRLRGLLRKSEAKFEPVDLNDLTTSTLRILHNEVINRKITTSIKLGTALPLVSGDPVQLQQVLLNLLLNAMDAMNEMVPSRRKITVSTRLLSGDEVEVRVADSGIGLSQSGQVRAFQPFFTTKERGLGLGLSLSSSIIRLHGGKLVLENNAEGGATATFRVPRLNVMMVAAK